jgi:thiamine pyrophosphokinase
MTYRILDLRDDNRLVAMTESGDVKQGLPVITQGHLLQLAGEEVDTEVTVLAGLGGDRDADHLARAALTFSHSEHEESHAGEVAAPRENVRIVEPRNRGSAGEKAGLLLQLAGEEVDTEVTVLAGLGGDRDADHLARVMTTVSSP